MKKIGLIFGGIGNEAEISIKSAHNVVKNFDYNRYKLVLIYWNKDGNFYILDSLDKLNFLDRKNILYIGELKKVIDIAFLVTHGRYGEDGTLQSILEIEKIKYCGCRIASSGLCMDKGLFKTYFQNKVKQVKFRIIDYNSFSPKEIEKSIKEINISFKYPLYVKPANSGSSIGITRINNFSKLRQAIKTALIHDKKIIVEEGLIDFREIEVAILGNTKLIISPPGELEVESKFYDYDNKYKLNKTKIVIPAKLKLNEYKAIKKLAEKVYRMCNCTGFARIDLFIHNNQIYLNEANTLPGFTDISMFPLLLKYCGLSYKEIINRIISLAI